LPGRRLGGHDPAMGFFRFLRRYLLVAFLGVCGVALFAFDMIGRIIQLWTLGVPGWLYELAAAGLLLASLCVLFYQLHSRMELVEGKLLSPAKPDTGTFLKGLTGPSYEEWDGVNRLTLDQAASLWSEMTPSANPGPHHRTPTGRVLMLQQAIQDGRLASEGYASATSRPGPESEVTRKALLDFAKATKQRPKFLFPDAR
jgi:hypothetical protein